MTILVTGSAGFLGNHIMEFFADRGHNMIGVDNLSRKGSALNAAKQRNDPRIKFHVCDIADEKSFALIVNDLAHIDWIIDCAAEPSVLAGIEAGTRNLINNNLISTINLLETCRERKCGFVLMSTSRVYSIRSLSGIETIELADRFLQVGTLGVSESFSTASPISLYGSTKLASEILAKEYSQAFQFPLWINRCGVIAGPGQFGRIDQGIFSYWIYSWIQRSPLSYIGFGGTGKQVRDVIHPLDVCRVLDRQLLDRVLEEDPTYNLGGGTDNSMSLLQLSKWCKSNIDADDSIVSCSSLDRPFDIPVFVMDSTKAKNRWGFSVTRGLDQILSEIRDHALSHPEFLEYLYS